MIKSVLHGIARAAGARDGLGTVAATRACGRLADFACEFHSDRIDTWCCFEKGLDFQADAVKLVVCVKYFCIVDKDCSDRVWRVWV